MTSRVAVPSNIVRLAACVALATGCGAPPSPGAAAPSRAPATVSPPTSAARSDLDELAARAILGDGLRRAGLRIVADVAHPVAGGAVVLDGWDGGRAIGFEYLATTAGDPPLPAAARAALGERVLVIGPCDEAALRSALAGFVARIGAARAQP